MNMSSIARQLHRQLFLDFLPSRRYLIDLTSLVNFRRFLCDDPTMLVANAQQACVLRSQGFRFLGAF